MEFTSDERRAMRLKVATAFAERAAALGYKGRKRDNALIDFLSGANAALAADASDAGSPLAGMLFLASIRGYSVITDTLKSDQPEQG